MSSPIWAGATVFCLGSGPSLTAADVEAVRGLGRVICVNDTYKLAPWADALYACDATWWGWHPDAAQFPGLRFTLDTTWETGKTDPNLAALLPALTALRNTGERGYDPDPSALRTGKNSGFQAVHLAVHLGAVRIVLLGYDMAATGLQTHFFGEHPRPSPSPYPYMAECFRSLVEPLGLLGVEVVNCTRRTALDAFPTRRLEDVLADLRTAAA